MVRLKSSKSYESTKSKCEVKGYSICMVALYPQKFGIPSLKETKMSIKDMGNKEYFNQ